MEYFSCKSLKESTSEDLTSGVPANDSGTTRCTHYHIYHNVNGKEATNALGFKCTPFTFDMGLLKDALEIAWARHN